MNKAIIFNCNYNGLSIIQALGRAKIPCIAMDCERAIGTYSKYGHYQRCPDPLTDEDKFIEFLYDYCKKQNLPPVLFPTNDHWAVAISKHKNMLREVSYPCVSEWNTIDIVISKNKFYDIGMQKEYLTPRTWNVEESYKIDKKDYPLIIKPLFRRMPSSDNNMKIFSENMDRLRFTVVNNKKELNEFLNTEEEFLSNLIIQQFIHGKSDCMYTVGIYTDNNSEVKGIFTGRKMRGFPAAYGDCIIGESHELSQEILAKVQYIVKDLKYKGLAEFEYKKDTETGKYLLIEINPRSWSWIGITSACGVNLPYIAYQDMIGEMVKPVKSTAKNGEVKYVKLLQDAQNCLHSYKYDYPAWHMSFKEWKKSLSAKKIVYAEFALDDPMVAIHAIKNQFTGVVSGLLKHAGKNHSSSTNQ